MSYLTGENLILARIKEITGYDDSNVTQADWSVLDKGNSTNYVICKSGGNVPQFLSKGIYVRVHRTIIQVWQVYKKDGTSSTNLYTEVDKVEKKIQDAEKLGDTNNVIQNSEYEETGEVEEMWSPTGGGPFFLKQDVVVAWREQVSAS